jgi:uncharacterized repeat protein (TIGR01451 family)
MNKILKASFSKTIQLSALKTIGRLWMILAVLITAIFIIVHHRAAAAGNSSDYRPVNSLPVSASPLGGNLSVLRTCTGLTIDKQASPTTYSNVGDVINYTYLVMNSSNETFEGPVTVTDDKIPVSCPPGDLAPGATIACTASYSITQADLDFGMVTNTAFASANDKTSDSDEETVVASQMPSLSLVKTATPTSYSNVADVINYNYLVKNTGNVTLAGPVTVTDDKIPVSCPSGGLAPGATLTCTASYTITQADLESGSVTNTAFASANGTISNSDDETVTYKKLDQTCEFTSNPPDPAIVGWLPYIPSASATSSLPVMITVDTTASSVCSISGSTVSFIGVGTCILNGNQEGNLLYEAASCQQSFEVVHRWLIFLPVVFPPITLDNPVPPVP